VQFNAEHPSEDFDFDGHVEGTLAFDAELAPDLEDELIERC